MGVLACLALLSLITVFNQVKTLGLGWQEAHYIPRLESVLSGDAPAPGAYRILSDGAALGLSRAAEALGLPRGAGVTLVLLRLVQNFTIFGVCLLYYRRLGIPVYLSILGVSALAWGMTHSNHNSDLSINIYTELMLYLGVGWAIAAGRYGWIIPLTILGALNRETSFLIPFLFLLATRETSPRPGIPARARNLFAVSLALWCAIQLALHLLIPNTGMPPHASGFARGIPLLLHNLATPHTWLFVVGVFGVVPVVALAGWRHWSPTLRIWCVFFAPLWLALHFSLAAAQEARFFLVLQALVFLPGALQALLAWREEANGPDHASVWS